MRVNNKRITFDKPVGQTYGLELQPNLKSGLVTIVGLDRSMKPRVVLVVPIQDVSELAQSLDTIETMASLNEEVNQ